MGVVADYPLAMAAGLGINAAVAFGLDLVDGLTPGRGDGRHRLGRIIVTALVLVGFREAIMKAVPMTLKLSICVGIGLFILFIGFHNGGRIGIPEGGAVPVEVIFPNSPGAWLTLLCLLITVVLHARKVRGALVISILVTAIIGLIMGCRRCRRRLR